MRSVRISRTAQNQLRELLAAGRERFGILVAENSARHIEDVIFRFLAVYADWYAKTDYRSLSVYPVINPPFIIVYDYDLVEVRIHHVFHVSSEWKKKLNDSVIW